MTRKIRVLALVLLLLVAGGWSASQGYFSSLLGALSLKMGGQGPNHLSASDFEFKQIGRKDIHQKVMATGTVTLKIIS